MLISNNLGKKNYLLPVKESHSLVKNTGKREMGCTCRDTGSLKSQCSKKDTFYEDTGGIECGHSYNDESLNEHTKNCRVG